MPKPHPQASPFHQPHFRDAERKLPVGTLPGSLDSPISTTSCYTAWHPLEGFRAWGNIRVTAAQSTHAHPKIAAIPVVGCISGRAGQALPETPQRPRTVSGRQCRWKKRAHQAPPRCSAPRWAFGRSLTESHDSLRSRDKGHWCFTKVAMGLRRAEVTLPPLHASTAVPCPGLGDFLMVAGSEKDAELQPLPLNHRKSPWAQPGDKGTQRR